MDVSGVSAGHAAQLIKSTPTSINGSNAAQTKPQRPQQLASNPTTPPYASNTAAPTQNARGQTVGSVVNTKA